MLKSSNSNKQKRSSKNIDKKEYSLVLTEKNKCGKAEIK